MTFPFLALIRYGNTISLSYRYCIFFLANLFHNFKKKKNNLLLSGGEKEEGEDGQDLRRTESDSGLKKVVF